MCKNSVQRLPFVKIYVPDQYKTQQMSDKVNLENGRILRFFPDCYRI